jgi:hypothetical protein
MENQLCNGKVEGVRTTLYLKSDTTVAHKLDQTVHKIT